MVVYLGEYHGCHEVHVDNGKDSHVWSGVHPGDGACANVGELGQWLWRVCRVDVKPWRKLVKHTAWDVVEYFDAVLVEWYNIQ